MFKPSGSHGNADALSRLPLPCMDQDPPIQVDTVSVLNELSESYISVNQVCIWTCRDPVLSRVLHFLLNGWPSSSDLYLNKPFECRKLKLSAQDCIILWKLKLSAQDCIILWRARVVIPPPGRELLLQAWHI